MSQQQKIPLSRSLSLFAQQKALAEIEKQGKALPGKVTAIVGALVTVSFDVPGANIPQVTMPVAMSKYARQPIVVGDPGVAVPSDVYIGRALGLGAGSPAAAALQPNLSALVWVPVSNTATLNGNYVLTDGSGSASITLTSSSITMTFGTHSIVINASGITIDGHSFLNHDHTGVTTGTGVSGGVNPAGP